MTDDKFAVGVVLSFVALVLSLSGVAMSLYILL
jgi:hypothetical protein